MSKERVYETRNLNTRIFSKDRKSTYEKMETWANEDGLNLRRAWILTQYHSFRSSLSFDEAIESLKNTFKKINDVTGTYWTPPDRLQILGRLREVKEKEFLKYYKEIGEETGFNIFAFALEAPEEALLYGSENSDRFTSPLLGSELKIDRDEWAYLDSLLLENRPQEKPTLLVLPKNISKEFDRELASLSNSGETVKEEPIPF